MLHNRPLCHLSGRRRGLPSQPTSTIEPADQSVNRPSQPPHFLRGRWIIHQASFKTTEKSIEPSLSDTVLRCRTVHPHEQTTPLAKRFGRPFAASTIAISCENGRGTLTDPPQATRGRSTRHGNGPRNRPFHLPDFSFFGLGALSPAGPFSAFSFLGAAFAFTFSFLTFGAANFSAFTRSASASRSSTSPIFRRRR